FDFFMELFACTFQSRRYPTHERWLPLVPCDASVSVFQSAKQRVVFKPLCLLLRKRLESTAKSCVCGSGVAFVSTAENLIFKIVRLAEVDLVGCGCGLRRSVE